ncbi:MAG: PKD domain-containing protein [Flavobacteriales bacterium]|nr:PKD domain-containing protein [Flavobacteriales bacterium]
MKHLLLLSSLFLFTIFNSNAQISCCDGFDASFNYYPTQTDNRIEFEFTSSAEYDFIGWNFGDDETSELENPDHIYSEPGIYQVCVVIEAGDCRSELCYEVAVETTPDPCNDFLADFNWNIHPNHSMQVLFENTSPISADDYFWDFGDGAVSIDADPQYFYVQPGMYQVCLVIENNDGCRSEFCTNVCVEESEPCVDLGVEFSWEADADNGLLVGFNGFYSGEINSILWYFGDGGTSEYENPEYEYDHPGIYEVCVVVENEEGCSSEYCHQVVVEEADPCLEFDVSFLWEASSVTDFVVVFDGIYAGQINAITWNFGDGNTSDAENPEHEYAEAGVYEVCVLIENNDGCSSEYCHEVEAVDAAPCTDLSVEFEWNADSENGNLIVFDGIYTGQISTILWHFGDGNTSDGENPEHEYDEPGIYEVCVLVESNNGCTSEFCHEIIVEEMDPCNDLSVEFMFEADAEHNDLIYFDGFYAGNIDAIEWYFGDGNTSDAENPEHEYAEPGIYQVCVVVENEAGCSSEYCHEIVISGEEPEPENTCCAGFESDSSYYPTLTDNRIAFENQSDANWTYIGWDFGDGNTSTEENPDHIYAEAGIYQVCVVIENENDCRSELCYDVAVEIEPDPCHAFRADFVWFQNIDSVGMQFENISPIDADDVSWIFGDGDTSTEPYPYHQYAEPGVYQVCLIIETDEGCRSEYCRDVCVEDLNPCHNFEVEFEWAHSQLNANLIAFDGIYSGQIDFIAWDFGDGNTSTDENPEHEYAEPGIYEVCVVIENNHGCRSEYCISIAVDQDNPCSELMADFLYVIDYENGGMNFENLSTGNPISYEWDFGDDHLSTDEEPAHDYETTGNFEVCLTIENADGCVATRCMPVFLPSYYFYVVDTSVGMQETTTSDLTIYPNPFTDNIRFSTPLNGTLELMDVQGRTVLTQKAVNLSELNLSGLKHGLYLMRVSDGTTVNTFRVVRK